MTRVVAITGGARGIGAATAQAFVADGARVAVGDLDPGPAGPGVAAYPLDVTDAGSFASFVSAVERDLGPLDVLVNNAGVLVAGPIADEIGRASCRERVFITV